MKRHKFYTLGRSRYIYIYTSSSMYTYIYIYIHNSSLRCVFFLYFHTTWQRIRFPWCFPKEFPDRVWCRLIRMLHFVWSTQLSWRAMFGEAKNCEWFWQMWFHSNFCNNNHMSCTSKYLCQEVGHCFCHFVKNQGVRKLQFPAWFWDVSGYMTSPICHLHFQSFSQLVELKRDGNLMEYLKK